MVLAAIPIISTATLTVASLTEQARSVRTFANSMLFSLPLDLLPRHVSSVSNFAWKPVVIKHAAEMTGSFGGWFRFAGLD